MSTLNPHEVETVFAGSFYKAETTYGTEAGTAGSGFTPFIGFNVTPTFQISKTPIEVQGFTLPTGVMAGVEHSEWSGDGWLSYGEMDFLKSYISAGPSDPNSFTLQHKKLKAVGCVVKGFSIDSTPEQMTSSLSFVGKKVIKQQTEQSMPTTFNNPHFFEPMKTTVTLQREDAQAGTVISKLNAWKLDVQDMWAIANYIDPAYGTSNSKQSVAQTRANGTFSMTLPMDDNCYTFMQDNGMYKATISNSTVYGATTYNFTIEFNFMWNSPSAPTDTNNIWTIELSGNILNSVQGATASNGAIKITTSTTTDDDD